MKRVSIIMCTILMGISMQADAQFLKKLKKKLDKKVKQTEQKLEKKIDKGVDDLLFGSDSITQTSPNQQQTMEESINSSMEHPADPMGSIAIKSEPSNSITAYSKFDFTPGTKLNYYEDFSSTQIGDFPEHWNTDAGAEVVQLDGFNGKWLKIGDGARTFVINEIAQNWQDDFTLEFDLIYDFPIGDYAFKRHLDIIISDLENPQSYISKPYKGSAFTYLRIGAGSGSGKGAIIYKKTIDKSLNASVKKPHPAFANETGQSNVINHVSIVKKGMRVKMYINSDKVIDMMQAIDPSVTYRTLRFASNISPANQHFYLGNIKYATQVEIPTSLFENGSYQAHGITFESGSAVVKPESYATIKAIAQEINAIPGSYQIIGHTDSDGDSAMNITLSQERAQSVLDILTTEFAVDPSQLSVNGAGDSQPLSTESSTTAKALNRRVEIKKV